MRLHYLDHIFICIVVYASDREGTKQMNYPSFYIGFPTSGKTIEKEWGWKAKSFHI